MKITDTAKCMRVALGSTIALCLAACASIGRPEGGPRDETPPVYTKSNPAPGALNVDRQKIVIEFNENVQIKDPMSKVVVSPAQKTTPQVSAVGHKVTVELRDTLLPNTTYTIDFADAISDLNEGNEIDGFAFDFSTGPTIDTLSISGMVFEAATLEPAQGMMVGVYSNLADSAIRTLPMERITKTNQKGQFTIRNLKPGTYRIYALNDQNRDYKWNRTEDVAFYDVTVSPSTEAIMVTDTLKAANGTDSIVTHPGTRFLPNDILLTWFNENYKSQYLSKYERPKREIMRFEFGAPSDTFPIITLLNGPRAGTEVRQWATLDASPTRDTLEYWITDPEVLALDTLHLEARFLRTDTLDRLVWGTDTLKINLKGLKKKKEKKKDDETTDSITEPPVELIAAQITSGSTQDLNKPILLKSGTPIKSINAEAVHFKKKVNDSTWTDLTPPQFFFPDSMRPLLMQADYKWEPGEAYQLTIDSLAITDVYGNHNKDIVHNLTTHKLEDYATVTFTLTGVDGPAMAELLNNQDKPVSKVKVENGQAVFRYMPAGTYYARLWLDKNNNGLYDGGLLDSIQPEEVFYLPKKLSLKQNWDIQQAWNIYETAIDLQKPDEIKKNKPKAKKGEEKNNNTDEEEDEYFDPNNPFGSSRNNSFGNNRNNNRNRPSVGGLRQQQSF